MRHYILYAYEYATMYVYIIFHVSLHLIMHPNLNHVNNRLLLIANSFDTFFHYVFVMRSGAVLHYIQSNFGTSAEANYLQLIIFQIPQRTDENVAKKHVEAWFTKHSQEEV